MSESEENAYRPPVQAGASPSRALSASSRVAVTIAVPIVILILRRLVPLPGVDEEAFARFSLEGGGFAGAFVAHRQSPFELGLIPVTTAFLLVEIVALIFPALRRLRHGGSAGRRKLTFAAGVVAVLLAVFQGYGVHRYLLALPIGYEPTDAWVVMPALVAGTLLLFGAAAVVSRFGVVSGIPWLAAITAVLERAFDAPAPLYEDRARLVAFAISGLLAVGIIALSRWASAKPKGDGSLRFDIPAPATGLFATVSASSGAVLAATYGVTSSASFVISALLLAALIGLFTNLPSRVSALWNRALLAPLETPALAKKHVVAAIAWGVGLTSVVVLAQYVPRVSDFFWTIVLVALLVDGASELRARSTHDLVAVFPEHRPYAIPVARELLRAEKIPLFVRSELTRPLFSFFGPFVPMDLLVPREDAPRATKLLNRLLIDELKPPSKKSRLGGEPAAPLLGLASLRVAGLAALIAFAGAAVWALGSHDTKARTARSKPHARHDKVHGALGLYGVDDSAGDAVNAAAKTLLPGMRAEMEYAAIGPGESATMTYVRAWANEGETLRDARSRLSRWIDGVGPGALPKGDRFAVGEYGRQDGGDVEREVRTYVVYGEPVLTEENVVDAHVFVDRQPGRTNVAVMVELDAAGAEAFEGWTGEHIQKRFAIVTNGEVMSAPVIQSRIGGGSFQITMGVMEESKALAQAKELAVALGGDSDVDGE